MAALAAPMRQIIKEETTCLLSAAAESVSTSSISSAAGMGMAVREAVVKEAGIGMGAVREAGIGAVREAAVKESPLAVSRVGGGVAEEGVAGATGRTNVAQHLEILNNNLKSAVHPPTGTAHPISTTSSTPTSSLHVASPPVPPIPNAHLHPTLISPSISTILESLSSSISSTARTSAEKSSSKIFSLEGGLKEAVENALQTGVQEQVEVVVDTAEVSNLNLNLNLNLG
ncbi:hypothetical protein HD553DRAFT_318132 [Filobasidium floriforme]|uniref:uncharacterized protein n=1 Tax=Filobasidium floriforme TaxID=5210 RepID=UPI001E8DF86F|nr:uncharacterized protein HD553DRAFT_318132 [Filobasidium floriforme]KAH8080019.1 hypothetical protein HD553DRAFT_318132 [Filobasidium floriforme]